MRYCPHCGQAVGDTDRFCSSCGAQLESGTTAVVEAPVTEVTPVAAATPVSTIPVYDTAVANTTVYNTTPVTATVSGYRIVLLSVGSCRKSDADNILEDLFGYTNAQAKALIAAAPAEVATGLDYSQARYLAQALAEYGMQVSIYDGVNYVDMSQESSSSVLQSDGSFGSELLRVLATLTVANRVLRPMRWTSYVDPTPWIFRPRYYRPAPPVYVRPPRHHSIFDPAPRPEPRPPMGGPRGGGMAGGPRGGMGGPGGGPRGGGMGGPRGGGMGGGPRGGGPGRGR